jgi:hypothetical protein
MTGAAMNATCIEGMRLPPHGDVGAFTYANMWGAPWVAWWRFASFAFASHDGSGTDAGGTWSCAHTGVCTADIDIGESIALERP